MCVGMPGVGVELTEAVAPDLVVAADAVEEFFGGQGVKSSIKRDAVDSLGKTFENLGCPEGLVALFENCQDGYADAGAAEAGLVQGLGGGFFGPGHVNIIYGSRGKGRR